MRGQYLGLPMSPEQDVLEPGESGTVQRSRGATKGPRPRHRCALTVALTAMRCSRSQTLRRASGPTPNSLPAKHVCVAEFRRALAARWAGPGLSERGGRGPGRSERGLQETLPNTDNVAGTALDERTTPKVCP